jgi:hypothetical protein
LDQFGAGNVVDTGNVTATGNVAWRRGTMTFSPIISAAGADPDSAATDPAGTAVDPAAAVPQPAVAPGSGSGPGQPATTAGYPGSAAGQTGSPTGQTGSPTGQTGSPTGQTGSPTGQTDSAADQADSAAGYADPYSTAQTGAATGQGGYSATEQGGYSAGQGAYSADAADSAQQNDAGAAWPHQTFLELGALPTAAPCARLHTTLVLWEWELGTLVRAAGLVVSELVSNAVQASLELTGSRFAGVWTPGTPPVRLWLSADYHRVVIQVWDGSDRPPVPQPVDPEADSGRGLLLVGALSAEWGCYTPEKSSGKVVWAVVAG